jgi:hypothetical protein
MARGGKRRTAATTPTTGPKGRKSARPDLTDAERDALACITTTAAAPDADACGDFASPRGCWRGAACRRRHDVTAPACMQYARGACETTGCRYRHAPACTVPGCGGAAAGCPRAHPRTKRHQPAAATAAAAPAAVKLALAAPREVAPASWASLVRGVPASAHHTPSGKPYTPAAEHKEATRPEAETLWSLPSAPRAGPAPPPPSLSADEPAGGAPLSLPYADCAALRLEARQLSERADIATAADDALRSAWADCCAAHDDIVAAESAAASPAARLQALHGADLCPYSHAPLPPSGPRRDAHLRRHAAAAEARIARSLLAQAEAGASIVGEMEAAERAAGLALISARTRLAEKEEVERAQKGGFEAAAWGKLAKRERRARAVLIADSTSAAGAGSAIDTRPAVDNAPLPSLCMLCGVSGVWETGCCPDCEQPPVHAVWETADVSMGDESDAAEAAQATPAAPQQAGDAAGYVETDESDVETDGSDAETAAAPPPRSNAAAAGGRDSRDDRAASEPSPHRANLDRRASERDRDARPREGEIAEPPREPTPLGPTQPYLDAEVELQAAWQNATLALEEVGAAWHGAAGADAAVAQGQAGHDAQLAAWQSALQAAIRATALCDATVSDTVAFSAEQPPGPVQDRVKAAAAARQQRWEAVQQQVVEAQRRVDTLRSPAHAPLPPDA